MTDSQPLYIHLLWMISADSIYIYICIQIIQAKYFHVNPSILTIYTHCKHIINAYLYFTFGVGVCEYIDI